MTNKAPFYASLRLIRTVFRWLLKTVVCFPPHVRRRYLRAYKAPESHVKQQKSIILHHKCQVFKHFGVLMTNKAPKKHVFSRLQIKVRPKGLHSFAFSLTSYGLNSTEDNVRKNNLFMQNKANFRKVKLNVNKVLTRG